MELKNEKIIRAFLLGEMAEEERSQFEDKFLEDTRLFEEIEVVENELIEKYIRGWMDPAETAKFAKNYLTTKKRREKVEFSRQLISKVQEQKEDVATAKPTETDAEISFLEKIAGWFQAPQVAMAAALGLIIALFGSWFLYQNLGGGKNEIAEEQNSNVAEKPQETITPEPDISPVETPKDSGVNSNSGNGNLNISAPETNNNIAQKTPTPKKTAPEVKKTPAPEKTPPIAKTPPSPVLALLSWTTRSGGGTRVLNLPANAKGATLQLNLESVEYKNYQASLTNADGNVVFGRGNLKASKSKINFFVPAKNLKRGDYIVKLSGKNSANQTESVADFQFRVN